MALQAAKINFEKQSSDAVSDEKNGDVPVFTLAQKKQNFAKLEDKAREFQSRIPVV